MKRYSIAVDIGGTNIRVALVNSDLLIEKKTEVLTESIISKEHLIEVLKDLVAVVDESKRSNIISIVLPCPYYKDMDKIVDIVNIPCLEGLDFSIIRNAFKEYDVYFENDVNTVALLEAKCGIAKNFDNVIYITVSTGIGSGVVINNRIYNGSNGYAGEIGSIIVDKYKENILDGTLENMCSGKGLEKIASELYSKHVSTKELFDSYSNGDTKANEIITTWIENISIGFANIIQVLDPDIIVLGGSVILNNEWVVESIKKSVEKKVLGKLSGKIVFEVTGYREESGLISAGYYALSQNKI